MKKKIIILAMASMLFCGIVSAASIWGAYKGNAIIKVNLDGTQYKTSGVPPVSLNGQVMLPLNILKQLGINYSYDSKKMTADLSSPQIPKVDLSDLKLYSDGATTFYNLSQLSDSFLYLDKIFTVTHLLLPNNPDANLNSSIDALNNMVHEYNGMLDSTNNQVIQLRKFGLTTPANSLVQIMDSYFSAIDSYKAAMDALQTYATDSNYTQKFLDSETEALNKIDEATNNANTGFIAFQKMIQDYNASDSSYNQPVTPPVIVSPPVLSSTINSRIDGDFNGFEYDRIYKLQNGQLWKQTSFDMSMSLKLSPKVTIFKDGSYYYMIVDGVDKKVKVELVQ